MKLGGDPGPGPKCLQAGRKLPKRAKATSRHPLGAMEPEKSMQNGGSPSIAPGRPVRWAIFGTGPVARKFVLGLRPLGHTAVVVCVASRQPANAQAFARSLGLPQAAPDYAAAAASDVDAVYIATPPFEHEAHALLAIAAGKAVLIEKPFAMDAAAARRIAQAAQMAGVFCMEAMWTRFLPLIGQIKDRIAAGEIGEVRSLQGSFCVANDLDPMAGLFDPLRGGGALMHRGVYPLSLARHLLGPVLATQATARLGQTGVDEDCALTLRHASGAVSSLQASLRSAGTNDLAIHGTRGSLVIAAPIYRPWTARLIRTRPRPPRASQPGQLGQLSQPGQGPKAGRFEAFFEGSLAQGLNQRLSRLLPWVLPGSRRVTARYQGNGYHYQAQALMQAIAQGQTQSPVMPLDESIQIMAIIDAARAQWGNGPAPEAVLPHEGPPTCQTACQTICQTTWQTI